MTSDLNSLDRAEQATSAGTPLSTQQNVSQPEDAALTSTAPSLPPMPANMSPTTQADWDRLFEIYIFVRSLRDDLVREKAAVEQIGLERAQLRKDIAAAPDDGPALKKLVGKVLEDSMTGPMPKLVEKAWARTAKIQGVKEDLEMITGRMRERNEGGE